MTSRIDILKSINSETPPDEAISLLEKYHATDYNPTQQPVLDAQRNQLESAGYNADEWKYYSNTMGDRDEEGNLQPDALAMEYSRKKFHPDIELVAIQGAWIGGVSGKPLQEGQSGSIAAYREMPEDFTIYVRKKPLQIEERE